MLPEKTFIENLNNIWLNFLTLLKKFCQMSLKIETNRLITYLFG